MLKEVTRIPLMRAGIVLASLSTVLWAIVGGLVLLGLGASDRLAEYAGVSDADSALNGGLLAAGAVMAYLLMGLGIMAAGFLAGAFLAAIYNVSASFGGGLLIELEEGRPPEDG
ncbi:MAG: hypothetical protein ACFBSD_12770 [Paracoccaceae bacterium]